MIYVLFAVPVFVALCFFIGAPLSRFLLGNARAATHVAVGVATGYALLTLLVEPLYQLLNGMRLVVYLFVLMALIGAALEIRFIRRNSIYNKFSPRRALVIALGVTVFAGGLFALPVVAGEAYGIYRTNSSDAFVNIALADLWMNARATTVADFIDFTEQEPGWMDARTTTVADFIEQEHGALETLHSESPIGVFSARFTEYGVRHATSMTMGLFASLFALPAYLAYLPFLLSAAAMSGGGGYALLRQFNAPHWFATIIAFSVLGGWSYIVRESDNSNQFAAMPVMVGALLVLATAFDANERVVSKVKAGAALAILLAAGVTIYPELGLLFAMAVGGAMIVRALISRRREDLIAVGVTAGVSLAVLVVNGQVFTIFDWVRVLYLGSMQLQSFLGPTGEFLEQNSWAAWTGLYVSWAPSAWHLPLGIMAAAALGFAAVRGAFNSHVGLAFALYALATGFLVWHGFSTEMPYVAYRALSFFGMISIVAAAASLAAASRHGAKILSPRASSVANLIGALLISGLAVGGLGYWTQSFGRPMVDYSTVATTTTKAYFQTHPRIEAAMARIPRGRIAVYLPPVEIAALPWEQLLYMHMLAAHREAVFISGFMHDNNDWRLPLSEGVYPEDQVVEYVLVSVLVDPVPGALDGEVIAHGRGFRLYRIAPTPWPEARDRLVSAPG
ncbi:MAG: hypothetical protein RIA71_04285 [Oceanicaulis sp.]